MFDAPCSERVGLGASVIGTPVSTPRKSRSGSPTSIPPLPRLNSRMVRSCCRRASSPPRSPGAPRPRLRSSAAGSRRPRGSSRRPAPASGCRSGPAARRSGRRDAVLAEVDQQLVQLDRQEALLRHRVEIAVEAVDDDDADACARSTACGSRWANSPGDSSAGSTCWMAISAALDVLLEGRCRAPQRASAACARLSSKMNSAASRRAAAAAATNCAAMRRLAGAGRADDQRAGAALDAAAEQLHRARAMPPDSFARAAAWRDVRGDQPREDSSPPRRIT